MKNSSEICSDPKITQALSEGSEKAFESIYHSTSEWLYDRIVFIVKDEDASKEILQNVFIKLWENRQRVDSTRSLKPYLAKIAENEVYDHFRRVAKDKSLLTTLAQKAVRSTSPYEPIPTDSEEWELLDTALSQLPPVRRKVFQLAKIEGKSYAEIAADLQISPSTISDHIVKGNRFLKDYMLRHSDDLRLLPFFMFWF